MCPRGAQATGEAFSAQGSASSAVRSGLGVRSLTVEDRSSH